MIKMLKLRNFHFIKMMIHGKPEDKMHTQPQRKSIGRNRISPLQLFRLMIKKSNWQRLCNFHLKSSFISADSIAS